MLIKNKKLQWLKWLALVAVIAVSLYACSSEEHIKDLHTYLASLKKAIVKHPKKDVISGIPFPVPVYFDSTAKLRDPFVDEQATYVGLGKTNPLTAFPVKLYEYVGNIVRGNQTWAVIKAPDNKIYQLTIQDQLGDHYGRIKAIYQDHIEIEEKLTGKETEISGQAGSIQIVNLQLKGGT